MHHAVRPSVRSTVRLADRLALGLRGAGCASLAACASLALADHAAAQGRLVGEAQTLDAAPYTFPEGRGALALGAGLAVSASVTNVPSGGDHAQVFGELVGAQQLYLRAVLPSPPDGLARMFGAAVAVGAGRIVVADPEAALGLLQGRVESWAVIALDPAQRVTLLPPEPACTAFGTAVRSDGARLAVLCRAQGPDAVRCFIYGPDGAGNGWLLEDRIAVPELPGDLAVFGERLSFEGARLALGAPWRGGASGAVLVYIESPTTGHWQLDAQLTAPGLIGFGGEVAISGDRLLATGAESVGLGARGIVVAFRRIAGTWTEVQRIAPAGSVPWDQFGAAIAMEGHLALIAAPGRPMASGADGAVELWTAGALNAPWTFASELFDGSAHSGDRFGLDVALDLNAAPPRAAVLATLDGRVQARALLLPTPLPLTFDLRSTTGVPTCAPNGINSRGTWGKLRGLGTNVLARNGLTLEAWDLPSSALIVFGASDREACTPLGAVGAVGLGVGGQTVRWFPAQANPSGVARSGVNLFGLPGSGPFGTIPVLAGSTWVFQGLYRDSHGGRLTEALRVTFE